MTFGGRWLYLAAALIGVLTATAASDAEDESVLVELRPIEFECPAPPNDVVPCDATEDISRDELTSLRERLDRLEALDPAQCEEKQSQPSSSAQKPTVNWFGELQADFYAFDQDDASKAAFGDIENGEAFRRARVGMFGDYGPSEYRISMDFALSGRPSFLDVYAGLHDLPCVGKVLVGHFFEPFSLERLTSNYFTTFMERSLIDSAFVPARNTGIAAKNTYLDQHGTWEVGIFRSDSDAFGDDVGDNFESAVTGRLTWLPCYEESCDSYDYWHLGVACSFRGANDEVVRFRSQPEARLGATSPNVPDFVDTGSIPADNFQLAGFETAWVHGPFFIQSEYVLATVDSQQSGWLAFDGWYAAAGYFLTGESRPYNRQNGSFDRVIPRRDFVRYDGQPEEKRVEFGPGAWEVDVRVSQLDLNDDLIRGGRLTDLTVGLNWYLNPYLRVTSNYIHAFANHPTGGKSATDIYAMRVGFAF
jgi:phosphate-selective porin OprO/OprP